MKLSVARSISLRTYPVYLLFGWNICSLGFAMGIAGAITIWIDILFCPTVKALNYISLTVTCSSLQYRSSDTLVLWSGEIGEKLRYCRYWGFWFPISLTFVIVSKNYYWLLFSFPLYSTLEPGMLFCKWQVLLCIKETNLMWC